jgi:hypothetical protein
MNWQDIAKEAVHLISHHLPPGWEVESRFSEDSVRITVSRTDEDVVATIAYYTSTIEHLTGVKLASDILALAGLEQAAWAVSRKDLPAQ